MSISRKGPTQLSRSHPSSGPLANNGHAERVRSSARKDLSRSIRHHLSRAARFSIVRFFPVSLLLCFLASLPILAEHTRRWRQSTYEEFLKGVAHGVAVRSDGRLELAPKFTVLADADASYLWSVRLDSKGVLFAAGGSPAKVFRFDSNGKPSLSVRTARSTSPLLPTARFTKFPPAAKNPSSSTRKPNTSGISPSLPTVRSTWPLATRARSSPLRPTAKAISSTPATRPISASSPSTDAAISSPAPNRAAASFAFLAPPEEPPPMASCSMKLPSAKSPLWLSPPMAPFTPPRLVKSRAPAGLHPAS